MKTVPVRIPATLDDLLVCAISAHAAHGAAWLAGFAIGAAWKWIGRRVNPRRKLPSYFA